MPSTTKMLAPHKEGDPVLSIATITLAPPATTVQIPLASSIVLPTTSKARSTCRNLRVHPCPVKQMPCEIFAEGRCLPRHSKELHAVLVKSAASTSARPHPLRRTGSNADRSCRAAACGSAFSSKTSPIHLSVQGRFLR